MSDSNFLDLLFDKNFKCTLHFDRVLKIRLKFYIPIIYKLFGALTNKNQCITFVCSLPSVSNYDV